eukprot:gene15820-7130_t
MQQKPMKPTDIPIVHEIALSGDKPVSAPSKAHTAQSKSPIVPVVKKDGTLRICIDYRQLNAKTIPTVYPIPRTDDVLDSLNGAKVFSVLDLKDAYHQIAIKEEDQHKTAFVVPWEKVKWKRMPFGLVGAPYTLSAAMSYALEE